MTPNPAWRAQGWVCICARKLANLIGGRIEFESQFGLGSRFTLLIPMSWSRIDADPNRARKQLRVG
jgi:hypothetical protein